MDYIWCLCKAKEPNIHLEAILYTFGGNFGSFQSQKSFGANLPPPVSQCKFQSLFQIGLIMTLGTGNYLTVGLLVSFPLLYGNVPIPPEGPGHQKTQGMSG